MHQFSDVCSDKRVRLKLIVTMKKGVSFGHDKADRNWCPLKLISDLNFEKNTALFDICDVSKRRSVNNAQVKVQIYKYSKMLKC